MKMYKSVLLSLVFIGASIGYSTTIGMTTTLAPSDHHVEIGESFNLLLGFDVPTAALEISSFEFTFQSLDGAFDLVGFNMLQPFDGSFSALPNVLGVGDFLNPVFTNGSSLRLLELTLLAVGPVGPHSVSVEGLLKNAQGAYFLDSQFNGAEADISGSVDLTIHTATVSDEGSTAILLSTAMVLFVFCQQLRGKGARRT